MGEIADEHYCQFYEDYDGYDYEPRPSTPVTCTRCGKRGFYWKETPNGWRLAKNGELHVCASPDVTDLFDIIEEEKQDELHKL